MRFVLALCLVAAFASAAMADPANVEPKSWSYDLSGARTEYPEAEPNDVCPGQTTYCGDVVTPAYLDAGNLDWYSFTLAAGDQLTVGTQEVNPGDSCDTYIELYFECGGTILAQDDDSGPGLYSLITNYTATQSGTYNLKVRGYSQTSSGPYEIFFQCGTPPPPPENDTCDGAIEIERCSSGSLQGDLTQYRNDYSPTNNCTGYSANGKDAVYVMNLLAGDIVDLTYEVLSFDTSFYILTDCGNMNSCVVGADETVTGDPEEIYWVVPSDGTYYLILDCYGTDTGGAWILDYAITCPGPEACCFPDGACEMLLAADCTMNGGVPQGLGTDCDPNPCEIVPTNDASWGQIKATYR